MTNVVKLLIPPLKLATLLKHKILNKMSQWILSMEG